MFYKKIMERSNWNSLWTNIYKKNFESNSVQSNKDMLLFISKKTILILSR